MKIITPITVLGLLALASSCLAGAGPETADASKLPPPSDKKDVTFEKDIKPIFQADCVNCHSGQRASSGLHLETLQGVLDGRRGRGGTQPVIKPGDSAGSDLVLAVARVNPRTAMPPPPRGPRRGPGMGDTNAPTASTNAPAARGPQPKNLTPEEVGLVRAWIDQGAK